MPPTIRSFRLVYVEDNPDDVYLLREALLATDQPVDLFSYHDVTSALAAITCMECPDLVVSDMNLPDLSGLDLIERLSQPTMAHIPVILLSGADRKHIDNVMNGRGAQVRCLTKGSNWQDYVVLAGLLVEVMRQRLPVE